MNVSRLKYPLAITGTGIVLGLVADLMLYDRPLGISVPIVITLAVIALVAWAVIQQDRPTGGNLWLLLPIGLLAAMSAVHAAPLLRFLNISVAVVLLLLLAGGLLTQPLARLNVGGYLKTLVEGSLLSLVLPLLLLMRDYREMRQQGRAAGKLAQRIGLGLLIAVPFLFMFTILFASADLIFDSYLERVIDSLNLPDVVGHTMLTAVLGWLTMGGLAYALTRTPASGQPASPPAQGAEPTDGGDSSAESAAAAPEGQVPAQGIKLAPRQLLGILEASIVLFSVDILFMIFVGIQFAALFGGEEFLQRQDLTYSEYARRGFFELLAVSLITLGLILVLDFVTRREDRLRRAVFLLGSALMIIMAVIILASAFQRLQLYELAYGFTTLRVYSHVFMIWLAVLLAYFLLFLFLGRTRYFATGALVTLLGFVITLNVLNPDVFIVRQNLARYAHGEELDLAYLGSLSADVVPHLLPLLDTYGPEMRAEAGGWLRHYLDELDERQAGAGWPAYHVSISRAYRLLDGRRAELAGFDLPVVWSYGPFY